MKILPLLLIVLLSNCSVSDRMAGNYCRHKLGKEASSNSSVYKDCFYAKKQSLLNEYQEYKKLSDECWVLTEKAIPTIIHEVRNYVPSQKIYDNDGNVIGYTEAIDTIRYKRDPDNEREQKEYHEGCMDKKVAGQPADKVKEMKEFVRRLSNGIHTE